MQRAALTEKILSRKRDHCWSWEHITAQVGGYSPIFVTAALLGQMPLPPSQAHRAAELFDLTPAEGLMLSEIPARGASTAPSDPVLQRLHEVLAVFGPALREVVHEEFGDGVMSSLDLDVELERVPDPDGDRVRITLTGAFEPYQYQGAHDGAVPTGTRAVRVG